MAKQPEKTDNNTDSYDIIKEYDIALSRRGGKTTLLENAKKELGIEVYHENPDRS